MTKGERILTRDISPLGKYSNVYIFMIHKRDDPRLRERERGRN